LDELNPEPWIVDSEDESERLIAVLIDPARTVPTFVLTVPEDAEDPYRPLIDPAPLASTTIGIARTVVLPAHFTWALTERFGKRLSVYGGAARLYLPGFTEDANPYGGHDLFLADRLSTADEAARVSGWMRRVAAGETLRRLRLGRDVLSFATVREQSLDRKRSRLEDEGASEREQLIAAQTQVSTLKEDLAKTQDEQRWLLDEHAAAEERAKTAEAQLTAASYRIQQLVHQLRSRGETPDENIALPASWREFGDWCDQNLVGRVLLSSRARSEVKAPAFADVGLAARCLLWLANDYRERRLHGGGGDLRVNIESGIQNDRCGADSFRTSWQGRNFDVEWHIKNGGNTRDPTRCLRIYYFWDEASQQIVIASMPAHIHTGAT
jgi:hypothetical protein